MYINKSSSRESLQTNKKGRVPMLPTAPSKDSLHSRNKSMKFQP